MVKTKTKKKSSCGCKKKQSKKNNSLKESLYDNKVKSVKKKMVSTVAERPASHHRFKNGTVLQNYRVRA